MSTTTRNRLIATAVLLVLVAAAIAVINLVDLSGTENEPTPTSDVLPALFPDANYGVVDQVTVTDNATGAVLSAHLAPSEEWVNDNETWIIDEAPEGANTGLGINHDQINGATLSLAGMTPTRLLEGVPDLAEFGLDNPAYTLSFEIVENDAVYTLSVGSATPTGSSYYVQPADGIADAVYIMPDYVLAAALDLVNSPPYLQATPEPTAETSG
jgi:hypothetical protein